MCVCVWVCVCVYSTCVCSESYISVGRCILQYHPHGIAFSLWGQNLSPRMQKMLKMTCSVQPVKQRARVKSLQLMPYGDRIIVGTFFYPQTLFRTIYTLAHTPSP